MRKIYKSVIKSALLLLCTALLCGCTASVELGGSKYPEDAETLTLVLEAEELPLLDKFLNLKSADLSGSCCYGELDEWSRSHPDIALTYTVLMPDGSEVKNTASELDLSSLASFDIEAAAELLSHMPNLKSINIGSGMNSSQIALLSTACPQAELTGDFKFMGKRISLDEKSLKLAGMSHEEAQELLSCLPAMKALTDVDLGSNAESSLLWEDIAAFQATCPQAEFSYDFTIYDRHFSLSDTEMDLNHIPIDDEGALVAKVSKCMPKLEFLDMDSCGVSDESMAQIRDSLPNTNVVWRIWFGDNYSVRTDVERILASNPGLGGDLYKTNTESLKYCTKVKYLDMGHNNTLDTIDFVAYMPELEVAILAMNCWVDARPLANCTNLEYAELFMTGLSDLRPLANLKNLRHLNIAECFSIWDISPLYGLTNLERLCIGYLDPVPQEQIEEMQRCVPNCEIDITTPAPCGAQWRYLGGVDENGLNLIHPRYALLREQFNYGDAPRCYSYYWNDPLYYGKPVE